MLKHTRYIKWSITLLAISVLILSGCAPSNTGSAGSSAGETLGAAPTAAGAAPAVTAPTATTASGSSTASGGSTAADTPQATSGIPNSGSTAAAGGTGQTGSTGQTAGVQYVIVPDKSEANYRVREQLANVSLPTDAVGKTGQISGAIHLKPDGTIDSASSKIIVDVTNLQSDRSMRDNFVRRTVLNTDQYPQVVFVPTQISGLPSPLPQSGNVTFKVTGDLTVRDVTKPITWDVTGTINGDQATGKATTSFTFEDFNLTQPRVPVVLSLEDHITLEVNVTVQKNGGATSAIPNTGNTASANTTATVAPATAAVPAAAPASACTSPAAQTPAVTEGPYFKSGSPEQANLIQQGMSGTKLTLTGYVFNANCQPVAHALLDFWQANAQGQYDNAGYTLRGHQYTDAAGRYQLTTVSPGLYPGRTEHIHVKVQPANGAVLTTQLFFPNVSQNQSDGIFDPHLLINLQDAPDGKQATFNFIVAE